MSKAKKTKIDTSNLKGYLRHKKANSIITLRSSWENKVLQNLEYAYSIKRIIGYCSEETVINYLYSQDNKIHRYFMDFTVIKKDGSVLLVEVKPLVQTIIQKPKTFKTEKAKINYQNQLLSVIKNQDKWKATREYCLQMSMKTNVEWTFEIWTEKVKDERDKIVWEKMKEYHPSEVRRIINV